MVVWEREREMKVPGCVARPWESGVNYQCERAPLKTPSSYMKGWRKPVKRNAQEMMPCHQEARQTQTMSACKTSQWKTRLQVCNRTRSPRAAARLKAHVSQQFINRREQDTLDEEWGKQSDLRGDRMNCEAERWGLGVREQKNTNLKEGESAVRRNL